MTLKKELLFGVTQYPNSLDWKKNYRLALGSINKLSREKADVVCFQEAFLSGYHPEVITYDFEEIEWYLDRIKEHAYKKRVCVVIPTLIRIGEHCYSSVYVFNSDEGDSIIYKVGLTKSEKKVMKARSGPRSFRLKGKEIGVLICREMEDAPYTYFQKERLPDLILWPSYWGWKYKSKWGPIKTTDGKKDKCYQLVKELKRPLVQANMSSTFGKKSNSMAQVWKVRFR